MQSIANANDREAISVAIANAKKETGKPSLIKIRNHIGFGSPNKVDNAAAHGSALGKDEVRLVKEDFGFDPDKSFVVCNEILDYYRKKGNEGKKRKRNGAICSINIKEDIPGKPVNTKYPKVEN